MSEQMELVVANNELVIKPLVNWERYYTSASVRALQECTMGDDIDWGSVEVTETLSIALYDDIDGQREWLCDIPVDGLDDERIVFEVIKAIRKHEDGVKV